jgi:hypothetical protein
MSALFVFAFIVLLTITMEVTWPVRYKGNSG